MPNGTSGRADKMAARMPMKAPASSTLGQQCSRVDSHDLLFEQRKLSEIRYAEAPKLILHDAVFAESLAIEGYLAKRALDLVA